MGRYTGKACFDELLFSTKPEPEAIRPVRGRVERYTARHCCSLEQACAASQPPRGPSRGVGSRSGVLRRCVSACRCTFMPRDKGGIGRTGTSRRAYSRSGPLSHFPVSGGPQPEGAPEQRSISRRGPFPGDPGQRKETSSNLRRVLLGGVNKSIPRVHFPAGERKSPSLL